ncbi:hypothetical protein ACHAWX_004538 [Stephanocyclus meneghinianus]
MKPTNAPSRRIMSPTNKPTSSTVEGFRKFGQGFCLDASSVWYSGFASVALPLNTPDSYCLEWCSQNLRPDLVAVEIARDTGAAITFCFCSFSGGDAPSDLNLSAYSPAASRKTTYPGVGAVQSTDDTANAVCYQNINYSNTPKPNPSLTAIPTQQQTLKVVFEQPTSINVRPCLRHTAGFFLDYYTLFPEKLKE